MTENRAYPYNAEVYGKLVTAAASGGLVAYSDLANRRMIGPYLFRITHEEDFACRPPITAIVVHKGTRSPGPGFMQAMQEIGYVRPGESVEEVWRRAVAQVYGYWRPKLGDDRANWPRFRE
jgi:hypothetical protein